MYHSKKKPMNKKKEKKEKDEKEKILIIRCNHFYDWV